MTFVGLFLTATKLAGALVILTVAANAFSYSRFRKKNLRRFRSPIDESSDTLALFNVDESAEGEDGLATAPAHVEDRLDDAWIQFAAEKNNGEGGGDKEVKQRERADAVLGSASGDGGSQQAVISPLSHSKMVLPWKLCIGYFIFFLFAMLGVVGQFNDIMISAKKLVSLAEDIIGRETIMWKCLDLFRGFVATMGRTIFIVHEMYTIAIHFYKLIHVNQTETQVQRHA